MPFKLSRPVCIPDTHVVPSKKLTLIIRGSGSTGTNNLGFILANPFHTANDSLLTTTGSLAFATVAYSNGSVPVAGVYSAANVTTPNGVNVYPLVSAPYALANYDQAPDGSQNATAVGAQSRVVGAGLRLRYAGTNLNKGGTALILRRDDGETFDDFNWDALAARSNTKVVPYSEKWHEVSYVPVQPNDYDYCRNGIFGTDGHPDAISTPNITYAMARHHIGIAVKSAAPSQPFDWEYIAHIEFLGKNVNGISQSHSDIVGMSQVRNVIASTTAQVQPSGPGLFNTLVNALHSEAIKNAPKLVAMGASKLLF